IPVATKHVGQCLLVGSPGGPVLLCPLDGFLRRKGATYDSTSVKSNLYNASEPRPEVLAAALTAAGGPLGGQATTIAFRSQLHPQPPTLIRHGSQVADVAAANAEQIPSVFLQSAGDKTVIATVVVTHSRSLLLGVGVPAVWYHGGGPSGVPGRRLHSYRETATAFFRASSNRIRMASSFPIAASAA